MTITNKDYLLYREERKMQVSYNLLKEYVNLQDISPEEMVYRLTMSGIVLERMEKVSLDIDRVVVGKIKKIIIHPEDPKLSICEVEVTGKSLSIVCGAKNMLVGDKVAVALEGARLPQLGIINSKRIKNILSEGMLCSASELGIEPGKSPGILILDQNIPLSEELKKLIGGEDIIFDFEISSNRPDLLSVIGIAREIAVIFERKLKIPTVEIEENPEHNQKNIKVEVLDEDLCPRYTGRVIRGITVTESPLWLKWKLRLLGIRPINNIVDITNLVMMETGQPLHAFDLDLIRGETILVRRSKPGEIVFTLDEVERQLPENCVVIADKEGAIAIGGIMGGKYSEINEKTKNVFLESAYFDPINNRKTSLKIGLRTEASSRFEKGIDKDGQIFALNRAADLINQIAGGKINSTIIDTNTNLFSPIKIDLRVKRVKRILGQWLEKNELTTRNRLVSILERLGFIVEDQESDKLSVIPPSFRADVEREIDLIEEIARIYGYDRIQPTLFKTTLAQEVRDFKLQVIDQIKEILIGCGLNEVITFSLVSPDDFNKIGIPEDHQLRKAIKIKNPLTQDFSMLRTSLISNLLEVVKWNINRQAGMVKIFEVGKIYLPLSAGSNSLPLEKLIIAGVLTKLEGGDLWSKSYSPDLYEAKGLIETVLHSLKIECWDTLSVDHPVLQPLKSGIIISEGKEIGIFGEIKAEVIKNYRLPEKVYFFEIDYENLISLVHPQINFVPLTKYPVVQRDLSLLIREEIPSGDIIKEIKLVNTQLIKQVILFDVFKGKQIANGYKSVAYSILLQSEDKTLTDQEIEEIFRQIRERLEEKFEAKIRE